MCHCFSQRRCYAATRISPLTEPLGSPKPSKVIARSAENVQVSKLPSGLVVASLETFSPVSKIGVFVKAGSRYEPVGNLGVTHLLRLAGNLTTKGVSAFKISRGLEALGSTLSVTSTREHMVYSLDFLRDDLFSILLQFHLFLFLFSCSILTGVSHSALKQVAQQFFDVHKGAGASGDKAIYHGGELRVQNGDSLTHTLLACEGAASGTAEANAFSVLQQLLGVGPQVKRGSSISSKLSQGIAKATTQPFDASAFNISYSDSGLFGLYTIAQAGSAKEVIKAAMAQVSAVAKGVSEQDLIRAKSQLKTEYLMVLEGSEGLLEEIGAQALASGAYSSPDDVAKAIDSVTSSDVANAAKKFVSSKKTMASRGHLVNTPFVDEL
uniref:Ubiquinol-cytochrome c reductase core protein 2a n=1 Tax=Astyanax mexicanus TaxID=7994 RepID=A0A8B9LBM7_ASTMX